MKNKKIDWEEFAKLLKVVENDEAISILTELVKKEDVGFKDKEKAITALISDCYGWRNPDGIIDKDLISHAIEVIKKEMERIGQNKSFDFGGLCSLQQLIINLRFNSSDKDEKELLKLLLFRNLLFCEISAAGNGYIPSHYDIEYVITRPTILYFLCDTRVPEYWKRAVLNQLHEIIIEEQKQKKETPATQYLIEILTNDNRAEITGHPIFGDKYFKSICNWEREFKFLLENIDPTESPNKWEFYEEEKSIITQKIENKGLKLLFLERRYLYVLNEDQSFIVRQYDKKEVKESIKEFPKSEKLKGVLSEMQKREKSDNKELLAYNRELETEREKDKKKDQKKIKDKEGARIRIAEIIKKM
jgi:hypothetical protein